MINSAALAGTVATWSISLSLNLSAGSHTIEVKTKWNSGNTGATSPAVIVSGGAGASTQSELTVGIIKN